MVTLIEVVGILLIGIILAITFVWLFKLVDKCGCEQNPNELPPGFARRICQLSCGEWEWNEQLKKAENVWSKYMVQEWNWMDNNITGLY